MEFFITWMILASVQLAATLSPGPAFAVTVKNALAYNRRAGVITAVGLGFGVGAHVIFVLTGLAVILSQSVIVFNIIKYAGAAYLIYIGFKGLRAKKAENADEPQTDTQPHYKTMSDLKALQIGFLTNLLNPKAVVFFTAVFTQFIGAETSFWALIMFGLTAVAIEMGWFATLSTILTTPQVKARFTSFAHWIDRVCGGLLMALGIRLALSKIH